jgi:uncharacterized ion transporter superfamily protein YfcC
MRGYPMAQDATSKFPHPLVLLSACILLAALLSYVLPAGQYDRKEDPVSGKKVVVPGTYHSVPAQRVNLLEALVAVPKGMVDAASVVFLVFLVGGAFTVVDETGALRQGVGWMARKLERRETLVIPIISLAFALGGALENMQEEIIALVPVLLLLARRLGFDPLTAVAMSAGSAMVGSAFSPVNPFQVGIAQKLTQVPLLTGMGFRMAFMAAALVIWIGGTMRYAARIRLPAQPSDELDNAGFHWRTWAVIALVLGAFAIFIYGVFKLGWDFDQMSAVFFGMGVAAGLVGVLGLGGTARSFGEGFKSMALAGLLIGFARAIYLVLDEGRIIDTIVHGLVQPLNHVPLGVAGIGMMIAQSVIHVPVPSVSGQAALTMPLMAPLSDLLGLSRQTTVLAYQYGAGLCELITPTNGALMAIIAAASVRFDKWLRFVVPLLVALFGLGALAVLLAILTGLK